MYWFLLELFTESDPDEDGIVILTNFNALFLAIMGNLMFRVMSLHQLTQAVVAKKFLLNMEIDVPKELLLNMEMEVTKELPLNMGIEVTKELPLNKEVEVTQVLPLNREMDFLTELPFNMETEVAKELPLNMGMEVARELPLNKEMKVTMEPRRGNKRSKEATQLHNTALPCSIVHCRTR